MSHFKLKIFFILTLGAALTGFLLWQKSARAALPALKEGTYLSGQTLSVWPSWSNLGNVLGRALPTDPINQLDLAGTCALTTNRFCTANSQCPPAPGTTTPENCVLHDPETGWSTTDRRFSFACSAASYAYRYIVATSGQAYTVRARFEDPGINFYNWKKFTAGFISSTLFKISEPSGVCNQDQEISTLQSGVCGDGRLNLNKGEQCDPPGRIEYQLACSGANRNLTICNNNCQWVASTTLCSSLSRCGNGLVEAGENCDDGALNGRYGQCDPTCSGPSKLGYCGDDEVQAAYEVCDAGTPDREKYSLTSRADSCSWDCQNWGPYCGDKIVQTQHGEECDGSQVCTTGDGGPGVKICTSDCKMSPSATSSAAWLCTATTTSVSPGALGSCGNGVVDASEACDKGAANNGLPCLPAYGVPCSYCSADCQNTIDVQPTQYCGNGKIEATEKCEKTVGGDTIYSVTANTLSTDPTLNTAANGYREKLCSEENLGANKVGKGDKDCAGCALTRNCVTCGLDPTGVEVNGKVLNVLQPTFSGKPDPLMVEGEWIRSLKLYFNTPVLDSCAPRTLVLTGLTPEQKYNKIQCYYREFPLPGSPDYVPILASVYKKPSTLAANLETYTLQTTVSPATNAKLNSNLLCSTGDEDDPYYTMVINNDYTHRFQFPVLSDPSPGQYDIVASPIITSTRSRDIRVVVSWETTDEFFGGFVRPSEGDPTLESTDYVFASDPPPPGDPIYLTLYATGLNYYESPASHKKTGIWYHGFLSSGKRAESFTVDTADMASGAYAFYVRAPGGSIESLKNIAKLKVEVFAPETDSTGNRLFGAPVRTYQLKEAIASENREAGYWHVFNLSQPSSGATASASNIIDVNQIITNAADIAIGPCTGRSAGSVCRSGFVEATCDVVEYCTGTSDFCPADVFRSAGTLCRPSVPTSLGCDLAESCTGTSPSCPDDSYAPAGTNCGTSYTCNAGGMCNVCAPGETMCPGLVCRNLEGTSCNDGNPCTTGDTYHDDCGTASSCYGTPKNCSDGLSWTTDSCNLTSGACVNTLNSCDDGNLCTTGDAYNLAGTCVGGPWTTNCCRTVADCTEENPCFTSVSCLPTNRCRYDLDPAC